MKIVLVAACLGALTLGARAEAAGSDPDPRYILCYRQVLVQPQFASLAPAELYNVGSTAVAAEVYKRCKPFLGHVVRASEALVKNSQKRALETGGTKLPEGRLRAFVDLNVRMKIGRDLAEADPRLKAIAESDLSRSD